MNQSIQPNEHVVLSLSETLKQAQTGPLLEAEMIPLTNQGKVRITYNWLYSALNCDPNDNSTFKWAIKKLDDSHVALSPKDGFAGRTLYASVRDDWNWYVEVQAAHSADWITAIGRDETIEIVGRDLLMVSFKGFNGQYIAVDSDISTHVDSYGHSHSGYRLRSIGTSNVKARPFFLGVSNTLQAGLKVPLKQDVTATHLRQVIKDSGLSLSDAEINSLQNSLQ